MNGKERYDYLQSKSKEYSLLRNAWKSELSQEILSDELKFITSMVRKDVIRTDRTHSFFKGRDENKNTEKLFDLLCTYSMNHPEVSYCQGMSDIASVMLVVQTDESYAYMCFCGAMKRLKSNFLYDGKAMTCKFEHLKLLLMYYDPELWHYMVDNEIHDLFFTYRWLLLELKREFSFYDSLYMLEIMWSTLPLDSPSSGASLSDVYILNSDGTSLISKRQVAAAAVVSHGSGSSSIGTPTPYTKLLSLRRKPSAQSMTPLAHESINNVVNNCAEPNGLPASPGRLSDISSEQMSVSGEDESTIESDNEPVLCIEPTSTFYLAVGEDSDGSLLYTDHCLDEVCEAVELSTSSHSNGHSSMSSCDSGIRTCPTTPSVSHSSCAELQFAFESSDNHRRPNTNSVLPAPDEFGFGNAFLMFASFTMIQQHRDHIIKNRLDFESIAMLFDRKVRKNNVKKMLYHTKIAYEKYLKLDRQTYDC